jgi:hypothetical protein
MKSCVSILVFFQLLKTLKNYVRLLVLTTASMIKAFFWEVAPCSLIKFNRRFRGAYCLHHQGALMM